MAFSVFVISLNAKPALGVDFKLIRLETQCLIGSADK